MARSLIINLMSLLNPETFLGIDKEMYLKEVMDEYSEIINNDIVVYIMLLLYNADSKKPELTTQKKMKGKFEEIQINTNNIDLGNVDTLIQIFNQIPELSDDKIENKVLVTWGHSMGYSMFFKIQSNDKFLNLKYNTVENYLKLNESIDKVNKIKSFLLPPLIQESFINKSDKFLTDINNISPGITALTINELSEVLQKCGIKFNLIIFDNCFLQTVDTFYALKDYSNYIIAPQTGFPWRGYDYSYFNGLKSKIDDVFCEEFCRASFDALQRTDSIPGFINDFNSSDISFSYINTEYADAFFENLNAIIEFFKKYNGNKKSGIAESIFYAISTCTDLTKSAQEAGKDGLYLIDIKKFLLDYDKNIKMLYYEFDPYYKKLIEIFEKPILKTFSGNNILSESNGLSIFFPPNRNKCEENPYFHFFTKDGAQVQSSYSKKTSWGSFLTQFLK